MIRTILLKFSFVKAIVRKSKKIVLPGFDGLPLYDVTNFFFTGISKGSITYRASAISFSFFLAVFPAVIFFFTLIPYIPIAHFQDVLMQLLKDVIPAKTYEASISTLEDIIKRPRGGLMSIGFILALYFSTNGINSLMDSFNKTYHTIKFRKPVTQRMVSVLLVLIITILILSSISLVVGSKVMLFYLSKKHILNRLFKKLLLKFFTMIILVALCFFAFSFIYYLAPTKRERYRFISAGSTFATILSVIASSGFNYYANNFAKYNLLYGSIGTLLLILMWIYFNSIIILIGFELNASIKAAHSQSTPKTKNY